VAVGFYVARSANKEGKGKCQPLSEHLTNVAKMTSKNADKIGLKTIGEYVGLMHDRGKYQDSFQKYICEKCKKSEQCQIRYDGRNNFKKRGEVDHSTVGAQISRCFFLKNDNESDKITKFVAEIVPLCIASHHTGLIDMLDKEGKDKFSERMIKEVSKDKDEVLKNTDDEIKNKIEEMSSIKTFETLTNKINIIVEKICKSSVSELIKKFYLGMVARFLLSCLIDADHTDSANFEFGDKAAALRQNNKYVPWDLISKRLEKHIKELNEKNKSNVKVKQIRQRISDECFEAGKTFDKGCYKLEVPTGGGKTLASFRFAVEMAKRHKLDRIIYCIPYTTIIEQNADTIRKIVEKEADEKGRIVIEHHSNLIHKWETKEEIDQNDILTENWDAPIIFTTNVQVLETLFGEKTSSTRRLHQLAKSVIIFDEIQTLPIKCVHMFNNAANFLVDFCNSSIVLCTATQPLLDGDEVCEYKGRLKVDCEIVRDKSSVFEELKRVDIINEVKNPYKTDDIAKKAIDLADKNNNCLVVCNTTKSAREIFEKIQSNQSPKTYHLSARMIPVHRKWVLRKIKRDLKNGKKIIVVSTQVVEAGIDIDFNCGIRALAGLDSIFQAAGRINRNGNLSNTGKLYLCEFSEENTQHLKDVDKGKESSKIVLSKHKIISPSIGIMNDYYEDYFYQRKKEMQYLCEHENSLLDLLSENSRHGEQNLYLRQSFREAAKIFKPIDDPITSVFLERGKAKRIKEKLSKKLDFSERRKLKRELQKYSLNIRCKQFDDVYMYGGIYKVSDDLEIFCLDNCYYNNDFGFTEKTELDKGGICV
jgi:CRISPR-associated endonuclease/helicase Cas3